MKPADSSSKKALKRLAVLLAVCILILSGVLAAHSTEEGASSGFVELWSSTLAGRMGNPVISNGTLYSAIGDSRYASGSLLAINLTTGGKIWSADMAGFGGTRPCISENSVFMTDNEGWLYSFDASRGLANWKQRLEAYEVAAVEEGRLYVRYSANHVVSNVYCLNASTGTELWCSVGPQYGGFALAAGGLVYLSRDSTLYALNASSGATVWRSDIVPQLGVPRVYRDSVYVTSGADSNNPIFALDASTGKTKWSFTTEGSVGSMYVFDEDTVYVCAAASGNGLTGRIYSLNAANGSLLWTFAAVGSVQWEPIVQGGLVLFESRDLSHDYLYAVDSSNGDAVWTSVRENSNAEDWASLAADSQTVYMLTRFNGLYAFHFATGRLLSRYPTPGYGYLRVQDSILYAFSEVSAQTSIIALKLNRAPAPSPSPTSPAPTQSPSPSSPPPSPTPTNAPTPAPTTTPSPTPNCTETSPPTQEPTPTSEPAPSSEPPEPSENPLPPAPTPSEPEKEDTNFKLNTATVVIPAVAVFASVLSWTYRKRRAVPGFGKK